MFLRGRKKTVFLLGVVLGAVFLWIAIRDVDFVALGAALASARFAYVVPFLTIFALFFWLKASRWGYLLRPARKFSNRELVAPMMIGFAGNNVLPVRLGELLRVYLLSREFGISKTVILATLILERVFDAICILVLLSIAMLVVNIESTDLSAARFFLITAATMSVAAVYAVVKPPEWLRALKRNVFDLFPASVSRALNEKIGFVRQGFGAVRSAGKAALIAANSMAQWTLMAVCIYISLVALGIQISPAASIIVLGLVVAGISIPSAPGFVGTIELCFVIGLGFFGVDASDALAAAIFYHVLTFASVTATGALLFGRYDASFSDLRHDAESANKTDR